MASVGLRACGALAERSGLMCQSALTCLGAPRNCSAGLGLGKMGIRKWVAGVKGRVGFNTSNHIYGTVSQPEENCSYFSFSLLSGLFWRCWSTPWAVEDPLTVTWGGAPGTFHSGICGWTLLLRLTQFYDCVLPESERERTSVLY